MDEQRLGRRLQDMRRAASLTQQELCQKANLSYSTLAKIERGAIKSPSIFTIQSIAEALQTSLDTLVGQTTSTPLKARSKSGVSFIYFDVNGCLVRFFHGAFAQLAIDSGVPADLIETTFWHYNDQACRGNLSLAEFNKALAERLGLPSLDWQKYYFDAIGPIAGMDTLVAWVAKHYRLGLLTNIMPGFLGIMQSSGLLPSVKYDIIIDSSEVGTVKPEAAMFDIAAQRASSPTSEILLIDDSRPNIMAAEKAGWHVLWFDGYHPSESIERIMSTLELPSTD